MSATGLIVLESVIRVNSNVGDDVEVKCRIISVAESMRCSSTSDILTDYDLFLDLLFGKG